MLTGDSFVADRCQTLDAANDVDYDSSNEDAESDYKSCWSYISNEDMDATADPYDDDTLPAEQHEVFFCNEAYVWAPIQPSDLPGLFNNGTPMIDKGWITETEFRRWCDAESDNQESTLDAMAILAETVGGAAREYWCWLLSEQENNGDVNRARYYGGLQVLLVLIMSGARAWTGTDWWKFNDFYIPSQKMYHNSFTSSLFQERILLDLSPNRPRKDLAEVMRIALPHFREMKARIEALSKLHNVDYSSAGASSSASIFGPTNMANIIVCLDVAESAAKLVPVLGGVLEGACGVLRKIIQAAEGAGAARDECGALAERTACITLAILNEIGSTTVKPVIPTAHVFDLCATIGEVEQRITAISKLGRIKYFASREKIKAEVQALRERIENARMVFKIRNDISVIGLLHDLRATQTHLVARVEDIFDGQRTMHSKLDMLLVQVCNNRNNRLGDSYVEKEDGREQYLMALRG